MSELFSTVSSNSFTCAQTLWPSTSISNVAHLTAGSLSASSIGSGSSTSLRALDSNDNDSEGYGFYCDPEKEQISQFEEDSIYSADGNKEHMEFGFQFSDHQDLSNSEAKAQHDPKSMEVEAEVDDVQPSNKKINRLHFENESKLSLLGVFYATVQIISKSIFSRARPEAVAQATRKIEEFNLLEGTLESIDELKVELASYDGETDSAMDNMIQEFDIVFSGTELSIEIVTYIFSMLVDATRVAEVVIRNKVGKNVEGKLEYRGNLKKLKKKMDLITSVKDAVDASKVFLPVFKTVHVTDEIGPLTQMVSFVADRVSNDLKDKRVEAIAKQWKEKIGPSVALAVRVTVKLTRLFTMTQKPEEIDIEELVGVAISLSLDVSKIVDTIAESIPPTIQQDKDDCHEESTTIQEGVDESDSGSNSDERNDFTRNIIGKTNLKL